MGNTPNSLDDNMTGDPFKDFATELLKVVAPEARQFIQKGRDSCYEFVDLLYSSDWKFHGKFQSVKVYQLQLPGQDLLLRCETKFNRITVNELIDYYKMVDKRMAWEGSTMFDSIEEVKAYPLNTSLFYFKLQQ